MALNRESTIIPANHGAHTTHESWDSIALLSNAACLGDKRVYLCKVEGYARDKVYVKGKAQPA